MRGVLLICGFGLLCAVPTSSAQPSEPINLAVGPGGRIFEDPDVDALLARPYAYHVPMTPTGNCVWAEHPVGWGFPQKSVHYYLITADGIGFDVNVNVGPQQIIPTSGVSYPTRVEQTGGGSGITVTGTKWITSDDVIACRLEVENAGVQPQDVSVNVTIPSPDATMDGDRVHWITEAHGLVIHSSGLMKGFTSAPGPPIAETVISVEGESPVEQSGSTGEDRKAAASGGRVLGSNFGSHATYNFTIPQDLKDMVISIRYARAKPGNAEFLLQLPNRRRHPRLMFQSTGGWGDAPSDFAIASYPLGDVAAGEYRVKLLAISGDNNVNLDALYLHPRDTVVEGVHPSPLQLEQILTVGAGETTSLNLFVASGTRPSGVETALQRAVESPDALASHIDAYNAWLVNNVPSFSGPEEIERIYWHRATSIVKKSLFRVGEGRLSDWAMAEGRWTSTWYPNMISYGAGHQIREIRWLRDPQYVRGFINTWCENEKSDGVFPNFIRPTNIGTGQYTDWITSTVWDAHRVQPDNASLERWAEALKKNVDGWLGVYDADNDGLLMVDSHWWTGMEWQPSFFYFNKFDAEKQEQRLERVDLTAYVYGNARNLARLLAVLGDDSGATHYNAVADTIRDAAVSVMWDAPNRFFYSVEPDTHKKAMVKEIIGVYPFYFSMFEGMDGAPYLSAWESILDREQFWTPWPVASASQQCLAYSQDDEFFGKSVGGCMWNGPTWPHANSIVLSAMAATLREYPQSPLRVASLFGLFRSYTHAQYYKKDLQFPWTGEFYNGVTGEWRTDQRDYNHSTYLDILIADIAGLRPREDDTLEFHPLIDPSMGPFVIDGIRYHDRDVTIAWAPATSPNPTPDNLKGFRVYVDGALRHHDPLCAFPLEILLP